MTEELARTQSKALDVEAVSKLGAVFKQSGYFRDVRDEAQAIVKILYGQELGLSPVVSMMSIHIVEGKPELSANLLASQVKSSGRYNYKVVSDPESRTECKIEFTENGEVIGTSVFTVQDAKDAGIYRNTWLKYPKAMLFARALSQGVRTHCPDVGMGSPLYVTGEISGDDTGLRESAPEPAKTERVRVERVIEQPAPEPESEPTEEQPEAPRPAAKFISREQQRELHDLAQQLLDYEFQGERTTEYLRRKTLGEWLLSKGYADEDSKGNPRGSTKVIPAADFESVKRYFRGYAESVRSMAAAVEGTTA